MKNQMVQRKYLNLEILFQEDDDIVYIVDEIDRCLHPLLTYNFINAFLEKVKTKTVN